MTGRLLMISSDCHIDFPAARSKDYLPKKHHDDFDGWLGATIEMMATAFASMSSDGDSEGAPMRHVSDPEGRRAYQAPEDNEVRLKALESQGVAAEIVIPNPLGIPFWGHPGTRRKASFNVELQNVGLQAYNRYLDEMLDPVRQGGLAMVGFEDVDLAVSEIRWAAEAGMRGLYLDGQMPHLPPLWDDYYEPIWAAIEDADLVATFHGGSGFEPEYDALDGPAAVQLMLIESLWFSHRPLWLLIYGGVLERHPSLRVAFTEQFSDWIPGTLKYFDRDWAGNSSVRRGLQGLCPRPPSEYWHRQCYAGTSIMSRDEVGMRHDIGIDNIMYGTDFAHPEGTWGTTLQHLQALFGAAGVPEEELRPILGENAARVYRFDTDALAPVVERCGFTVEEALRQPPDALDPQVEANVGRPVRGW